METLSVRVGRRIREFRRARGLTVAQLSQIIGKSDATLYKYESGEIAPDVNQIQQIALALQTDPVYFFDIPEHRGMNTARVPYLDTGRLYTYYFDGRVQKLTKSLLLFYAHPEGLGIHATFYLNVKDFSKPERSRYIYSGSLISHDTVSYFVMQNATLPIETFVIEIVHPMQITQTTWGLFLGLSDEPATPMAAKMLFSRVELSDQELTTYPLTFTKEELKSIRHKNAILLTIRESAYHKEWDNP